MANGDELTEPTETPSGQPTGQPDKLDQEGEMLELTAPNVRGNDPLGAPIQPEEQTKPAGQTASPPEARSLVIDNLEKLVYDVCKMYRDDIQDRLEWNEARIQRTAKYRGWREEKIYPWVGASNAHLPVIMTDVQRTEDTLHNAVLSVRPVMNAKASNPNDVVKERGIDMLLDFQLFKENDAEIKIAKLISSFVQDGQFIAFTPYVRSKEMVTTVYQVPFPKEGTSWDTHIWTALRGYYPKAVVLPVEGNPWKFEVREENELTGDFKQFFCDVTKNGEFAQLSCRHDETTFEGPCLIPKELEDVVVPVRCENLQPRTVANPTGADRVVLVDYPTLDEIKKLRARGFYDLIDDAAMEKLEKIKGRAPGAMSAGDPEEHKRLKDDLEGRIPLHQGSEDAPQVFTRLMYFGHADLDGDGLDEDVIYWIIEDCKLLVRARYLTEVYPSNPPRRPLQMAKYLPINDRFYAIGLIELMESGYDIIKETFDQMIDAGHLANMPFGFYRPASNVKPEQMKLSPGTLIPISMPQQDVFFPQMQNGMTAFGANIIGLTMQILDQVTLVGQLQLGGVPQGKSAALRTSQNMQSLLQQGDARPERVLRRFFHGLADIWRQFHILDKAFLPAGKRFRIQTEMELGQNPYLELTSPQAIEGNYDFEFGANILNTNKSLANQATQEILGMIVNPAMMMLGIVTPQNIYTAMKEFIRAKGQDHRKYITPPQGAPDDTRPMFTAEDAINAACNEQMPYGKPMEPIDQHLAKIMQFMQQVMAYPNPDSIISVNGSRILGQYAAQVQAEMQALMQQQQLMAQMAQMQQNAQPEGKTGPKGETRPPNTGPAGNPPVQGEELLSEDLAGSGGGAAANA
jgi:hypothetical protein